MDFQTKEALNYLAAHYPDSRANNNDYKCGKSKDVPRVIEKQTFFKTGMKQTRFQYIVYDACTFKNAALTGSQFHSVQFRNTTISGSSFACCDLFDVELNGDGCLPFASNNLSLSNYEFCRFKEIVFLESGILNSLFHNCYFDKVVFQSSTLEGSRFANCHLHNCDLRSVNIEFTHFSNVTLDGVFFPFYQLPYVIGAADFITSDNHNIMIQAGEKRISKQEYKTQLDRLILYFSYKREYFPVCNLFLAKNDIESAQEHLLDGISTALRFRNFRMIRYFCQLALHHNMLNEFTRQRILRSVDDFLTDQDIPETQLNYYMTYVGNIKTLLHSRSSNSIELNFDIKTNVQRYDADGLQYVNGLICELNKAMSHTVGQDGFQLKVTNFSPYEITMSVLSAAGSAASIASLIWMTIDSVREKKEHGKLIEVDAESYRAYIDERIDNMRLELLELQRKYSKKKLSKYINEVTQHLKTDLEELYDKDILIFRVKNQDEQFGSVPNSV